jgi:hypothetical protein
MAEDHTGWRDSKELSRAILHDRAARRKFIGQMLMTALLMMACGLWFIDGWLASSAWLFLIWWGACAILTCLVMCFALHDALAAIREERGKDP